MGSRARITAVAMVHPAADRGAPSAAPRERVALAGLATCGVARADAEASLDELDGLARTAGARIQLRVLQDRERPDAALFLGRGRVERLATACRELEIETVIVDNELTPAQLRNLEQILDRKVIDRTQLILDIFAHRARTREGKLQVELAQMKYLLPRLVGVGAALSRLGGGIGTRGPGETKLETDRRRIRRRIAVLAGELKLVRDRRSRSRQRRRKSAAPVVTLVGYTNAGKTTLFNALTHTDALASAALFATLDPLVRQVRLPDGQRLLLSDTVGFIDRLPHTLVTAFRATLEEVARADLLVHVIDASSPTRHAQAAAVRRVLEEVGASDVPRLEVFNKTDLLSDAERQRIVSGEATAIGVSALRGDGQAELLKVIARRLALDTHRVTLVFDEASPTDRDRIARLYRHARVLRHQGERGGRVSIEADVPKRAFERLARSVPA